MNRTSNFVKFALPLVLIASTGALASAAAPRNLETNALTVTVHIYDYAQVDSKSLLAAEKETDAALATAGVTARWIDCPTSHSVVKDFPGCQSPSQFDDYTVVLLPNNMAGKLSNDPNVFATETNESHRAAIFYDRISARAGGNAADTTLLAGRVMAREIGAMLVGRNAAARAGILKSTWTADDLSMQAGLHMGFTPQQAQMMQARLIHDARARQPQTQVASSNAR